VLGAGLWARVLVLGATITLVSLGAGVWARAADRPWQTVVFLTLGMAQFGVALGVRARPGTWSNPFLLLAVAGAFLLQLGGVYLAPLQSLLDTDALRATETLLLTGAAVVGYAMARALRTQAIASH
jgi:Ca2+-transporting ATPase